jgi:phosphoribosylformylglycinamidine synthase
MAMAAGIGATVVEPGGVSPTAALFGEDQGRYLVTAGHGAADRLAERAARAGVGLARIGATGTNAVQLGARRPISVAKLKRAHENWFPAYMAG